LRLLQHIKPKIERIYGNERLSDLKGALKVFVKAEGFSETEKMLHQFNFGLTYPSFLQPG
jgi:hypothetical protein